jgi:putative ABC transport system substrate-binding protein
VEALQELGYIEHQNLIIEYRDGQSDRLAELAAELVRLKLDLIVGVGTRELLALKAATSRIPIVMLYPGDPVGAGVVSSLTHPGGNITGTSLMFPDLGGKRLQLLHEIVPRLRRVTLVWNSQNASTAADMRATEVAAKSLGLTIRPLSVDSVSGLDGALAELTRERTDGVVVLQDTVMFTRRRAIAEAALRNSLPTAFPGRAYVESGGLLGYGPDLRAIAARAAAYVDKVVKGTRPADLPIEQPTKFELVINLKTAKALGLTIPPSVLARADQLIE